jgi:hypothetical protein
VTGSQDSSVGVAIGYGLDGPGSIPGNARFFSSPHCPERLWDLLSNGYRGVKRQGREVSAEVKNGGFTSSLRHTSSWHSA